MDNLRKGMWFESGHFTVSWMMRGVAYLKLMKCMLPCYGASLSQEQKTFQCTGHYPMSTNTAEMSAWHMISDSSQGRHLVVQLPSNLNFIGHFLLSWVFVLMQIQFTIAR